jgi:hypothetical protein
MLYINSRFSHVVIVGWILRRTILLGLYNNYYGYIGLLIFDRATTMHVSYVLNELRIGKIHERIDVHMGAVFVVHWANIILRLSERLYMGPKN